MLHIMFAGVFFAFITLKLIACLFKFPNVYEKEWAVRS